jgi:D-sedoheptulose 7-phosphate isomerase
VTRAAHAAASKGMKIIALTGAAPNTLSQVADACVSIAGVETARVQEMHILIGHVWCAMIDDAFSGV